MSKGKLKSICYLNRYKLNNYALTNCSIHFQCKVSCYLFSPPPATIKQYIRLQVLYSVYLFKLKHFEACRVFGLSA
jgi:hypothetical protein